LWAVRQSLPGWRHLPAWRVRIRLTEGTAIIA
jgi:hypothetical protein